MCNEQPQATGLFQARKGTKEDTNQIKKDQIFSVRNYLSSQSTGTPRKVKWLAQDHTVTV